MDVAPGQSVPGLNDFYQKKGKKSNPSRQAHANEQWHLSLTSHPDQTSSPLRRWSQTAPSAGPFFAKGTRSALLSPFLTQPSCLQSQYWLSLVLPHLHPSVPAHLAPVTPHLQLCPPGRVSPHTELLRASLGDLPSTLLPRAGAGTSRALGTNTLPSTHPPSTWALLGRRR